MFQVLIKLKNTLKCHVLTSMLRLILFIYFGNCGTKIFKLFKQLALDLDFYLKLLWKLKILLYMDLLYDTIPWNYSCVVLLLLIALV